LRYLHLDEGIIAGYGGLRSAMTRRAKPTVA